MTTGQLETNNVWSITISNTSLKQYLSEGDKAGNSPMAAAQHPTKGRKKEERDSPQNEISVPFS